MCGLAAAAPAFADSLALDFTGGTYPTGIRLLDSTVGWTFTVNSSVTVAALGVFDFGSDGLALSHQVGIWDSTGTLLVSTTVSGSGTLTVNSTSTDGQWVFNGAMLLSSAGAATLGPGQYTIGALYTSLTDGTHDIVMAHATSTTDPAITFGDTAETLGSSFVQPTFLFPAANDGGFGPNFLLVSDAVLAPEPATWGLMILAFAGLGFARRRRGLAS
jgi:hypothetical protein